MQPTTQVPETALQAQIRVTTESVTASIMEAAVAEAAEKAASKAFWDAVKESPELWAMHENWCKLNSAKYDAERRAREAKDRLAKAIEVAA